MFVVFWLRASCCKSHTHPPTHCVCLLHRMRTHMSLLEDLRQRRCAHTRDVRKLPSTLRRPFVIITLEKCHLSRQHLCHSANTGRGNPRGFNFCPLWDGHCRGDRCKAALFGETISTTRQLKGQHVKVFQTRHKKHHKIDVFLEIKGMEQMIKGVRKRVNITEQRDNCEMNWLKAIAYKFVPEIIHNYIVKLNSFIEKCILKETKKVSQTE